MEILTLKFVSPKLLNELGEASPQNPQSWFLVDTQDELELNTANWVIATSSEQAIINQWEVNESTHTMRIKTGSSSEGFEPLDYPFAVSMIGQIGNKTHLQDYLNSLQQIYLIVIKEKPDGISNNQ